MTFAVGVGLAGLWWGLTVGLTVVTFVSLCQLAFVDWERETTNAAQRMEKGELESVRRLSVDGFD